MRSWLKAGSILITVVAVVLICSLLFVLSRRRGTTMEGIHQTGPEQSVFFVDGDCSKAPFWFTWPDQLDEDSEKKLRSVVGRPEALRLKLRANVSPKGKYGHLGGFTREVEVIKVISVDAAKPCPSPWPTAR